MKKHRWIWIGASVLLLICLLIAIFPFCFPSRSVWEFSETFQSGDDATFAWIEDSEPHFHAIHDEKYPDVIELLDGLKCSYRVGTRSVSEEKNMVVLENGQEHTVQYLLFNENFTVVWVSDKRYISEYTPHIDDCDAYRVKNPWAIRKFFKETCEADPKYTFE